MFEKQWPDNPRFRLRLLLNGANACPPEDVGDAYGHLELARVSGRFGQS